MTAPHGRRSRSPRYMHACAPHTSHTHPSTPLSSLLTTTTTRIPPLPLSHLPQITALRKLMINLSTALDDPSITKLVEEQLPHYLNEEIGDVACGLRHFLLESGVPEASLFVQVCLCLTQHTHTPLRDPPHPSPSHTLIPSPPFPPPPYLSYPHTLLPSLPTRTHYR